MSLSVTNATRMKPILDIIISSIALIVTAPIMLIIALVIHLDSGGPALFRQVRIGQNRRNGDRRRNGFKVKPVDERRNSNGGRRTHVLHGQPFKFYKFRTMQADARQKFPELYKYRYSREEIKKIHFKMQDDPRLTRIGRVLRKTSLDELPNFINVLKGDMSIVGPRPDIPEMMKYYEDWQTAKFKVKPGVTGPSQVNGRGNLSFQDTLKMDVDYVQNRSARNDVAIFLTTIKVLLKRTGAF